MMKKLIISAILIVFSISSFAQFNLGTIEDVSFFSQSLQKETSVRVYLPPGYNPENSLEKYPVIFSLHGASKGNEVYSFMFPIIDDQGEIIDSVLQRWNSSSICRIQRGSLKWTSIQNTSSIRIHR